MEDLYRAASFPAATDLFKQAVGFLSKHYIPPSPFHLRLAYDFAENRERLVQSNLAPLLSEDGKLTIEQLWEICKDLYNQDDEQLSPLRDSITELIVHLQQTLLVQTAAQQHREALHEFELFLENEPTANLKEQVDKMRHLNDELQQEQAQACSSMEAMCNELEQLQKDIDNARREARTDDLTGIFNRNALDIELNALIELARANRQPFCLILADIDHFKQFNDNHGHLLGDKVLKYVANQLRKTVKGGDFVARYGGEEFAILLPETPLAGGMTVAGNLQEKLASHTIKDPKSGSSLGKVTMSFGVAEYRGSYPATHLIGRADKALYAAKKAGRNCVKAG